MAGIKRTPADIAVSKCVREAADWTCITCGTKYPEGHGGLECSHGYSRGNWSVRFKHLNARAQCTACHFRVGPQWVQTELNDFEREVLAEWQRDISMGKVYRRTKGKGTIAAWYREQYDELRALRECGATGLLTFEDFF